jgi:hypothetical protein
VSNIVGLVANINTLNGTNYPTWKEKVLVVLGVIDYDHALREDKPATPTADASADTLREYNTKLLK